MKQEDALSGSLKCLPTRRVVGGYVGRGMQNVSFVGESGTVSTGMPLSPSRGAATAARAGQQAEQSPQRSKKPPVRRGKEAKREKPGRRPPREKSLSGGGAKPTPPRETAT